MKSGLHEQDPPEGLMMAFGRPLCLQRRRGKRQAIILEEVNFTNEIRIRME